MANKDRNFIIRISEKLLEEFQEFCDDNSMNASKRIILRTMLKLGRKENYNNKIIKNNFVN